jgi:hypothetical protein
MKAQGTWLVLAAILGGACGAARAADAPASAAATDPPPVLMVLDPTTGKDDAGAWIKGTKLTVHHGNVAINSHSHVSLNNWGSQIKLEDGWIGVCGSSQDNFDGLTDPLPKRIKEMADPFKDHEWKLPTKLASPKAVTVATGPTTGLPGTYIGGIKINNGVTAVLAPGVYYVVNGDFVVEGTIRGEGVTIVIGGERPGTFKVGAWGTVDISAPTQGDYAGFCVVDTGSKDVSLWGQGRILGAFYAPTAKVSFWISHPYVFGSFYCWLLDSAGDNKGSIEIMGPQPADTAAGGQK